MPAPDPGEVAWSLFLIGDAGAPHLPDDPTFAALRGAATRAAGRGTIVFLGDNTYPDGLPAATDPARAGREAILRAQLAIGPASGLETVMLPGNHDWEGDGHTGWDAVRAQEAFVRATGDSATRFLPGGGCPGPVIHDAGPAFRLVVLDTEWWLHDGPKPGAGTGDCTPDTPEAVVAALMVALADPDGRHVVVATHHPLASAGKHGGHFSWRQHLFPLVDAAPWAWVPLPIIGSMYPLARRQGISPQDVSNDAYAGMIVAMVHAMAPDPPLAWASGHEHTLQVLGTRPALLVSGTGSTGHGEWVGRTDSTRYASSRPGWMRLDAMPDGRVRLAVLEVDGTGTPHEAWSDWLSPVAPAPSR